MWGTSVLEDSTLPAAFHSADRASLDGQRQALAQVRWSLRLGVVAAATGAASWQVGEANVDPLAAVGCVAFVGVLVLTGRLRDEGFEARWYRGRAIAESVKSLTWRYAVGGDPFALVPGDDVDARFVERVQAVVQTAAGRVALSPVAGDQITSAMRALRAADLDTRRDAYVAGRVEDQATWYRGKAAANRKSADRWSLVNTAACVAGVAASFVRFAGWVDIDILGIAAALAGAATAWSQLRQHRVLAESYALTADELSLVREKLRLVSDQDAWALAVSDAEDAISREHTMWLARYGHTPP